MPGGRALEFVGRERELDTLRALLDDARDGRLRIAVVHGEAGIGKTRLVDEVLEAREDFEIYRAKCDELDRARAFNPLAEAFGCARSSSDPQRARIAGMLAETIPTDEISNRHSLVIDAFLELIEQIAVSRPLALVLDDLQWADQATLAALRAFSKRLTYVAAAIVAAARPVPRPPELERLLVAMEDEGALSLTIEPLDDEHVGLLVARALQAPPDDGLARFVAGAAGNPLFIGELLGALDREDAIQVEHGLATTTLVSQPPDLRLTILRRITFLSAEALRCLRFGAILGSTFSPVDLATVAETTLPAIVESIEECVRARLLEEHGDRLRFRHDLIWESLYLDVPEGVRAGLHVDAARALEAAKAPLVQVAQQFALGARPGDRDAVQTMWRAALDAESSPAGRVQLLERALSLTLAQDPSRESIEADLAETLVWGGHPAEGERRARELLPRTSDPTIEHRMRSTITQALRLGARFEELVGVVDGWLSDPRIAERERVELMAASAFARGWSIAFDPDEAVRIGREALEIADRIGDDEVIVHALLGLSMAMNRSGEKEALVLSRRAVKIVEANPEERILRAQPHWLLGHGRLGLGQDPDGAERVFRTGLRIAEERGRVSDVPLFLDGLAFVHFRRWEWDEAAAEAEASIAAAEEVGTMFQASGTRSILAHVSILRGELERAAKHIEAEERFADELGSQIGAGYLAHSAMVHDIQGDLDRALAVRWEEFVLEKEHGGLHVTWWPCLWLALLLADASRAEAIVDWLAQGAEREEGAWVGQERLARAMVARDPEAISAILQSDDDVRIEAHERAALAFGWAGLSEQAVEHYEAIRPTYERVGAFPWLDRIARHLQQVGVSVPRRRRRARAERGWEALTDAERRVAELAAQGLTNPQIGERLFISRRTVQTHLAHAFAKIGISSRVELATEVARRAGA